MRHRRFALSEEEQEDSPLINLTPLIDVVFVVLITFMLIAPVLDRDRVELASSSELAKQHASSSPLSITVREDNSIWVAGRPVALSELKLWLQREHEAHPALIPQLFHDKRAQFGTYQAVKNVLEESGFEEMDLLLQP